MASNIGYKQFPEFDVRNDPETVYARFAKYAKRFKNNHLKAYNITDEDQQRSLFLDSIGEATLDILEQLDNTGTDLDGAITALRNKFKESQNRLFNIHKFRSTKQGNDETWDSFIAKLRAEGEHCDFPAGWLDTEILMAMIENGKSKKVRRKLLQDQLTLAEALKYARGLESADQHAIKVENQTTTEVTVKQEINKTAVDQNGAKLCFNCGKHWPHQGGQRKCPAFGKQCTRGVAQGGEKLTDTSSDSSVEESTCSLQEVNPVGQSDNRPLKTVLISGVDIMVLPDSSATVNAMDEATFKKYGLDERVKIKKSRCQMKPYGVAAEANALPVLGCFDALTESKTKMKVITWQLIKGDTHTEPLLGYEDARDLGMILVTNSIAVESNQPGGTGNLNEVLEKYKDRLQGIGKLKGIQVDLNVDPDFKPVAQATRRQPFSVRQKMEEEIQHLIDQDIIEKVNEPTGWVSPPVVTPKKDQSQIRLNVDMHVANQAIPRRYTQHPTIDDMVNELSGSTVFSHLPEQGYHQLELKESSLNVTIFSTHIGLYRYKRLNYDGIVLRGDRIFVPEKLRHRMVEIAHEGHQGQVRTKQLLRAHVWFPGMDSQCEKFVSMCIACQSNTSQTHREPLKMTDLPEGPWDKVSVDFWGPMASGDLALVFYCQYARYPVVEFVGSTNEKATIPIFRRVFDTYGVPKEIKSDNGPTFNSHKFEE
ncbi:Uncharacterized protein P5673_026409 [Acropora cervicornis]|uniref:Integrase catalytic domain-containing protein n=1 Tax=Acropora cervicornis TaxID=6130 RepID=A0AAD9Q0P3_ACRCE|nr:Uncharacterized protein P5673_026409 [Acropora cervicornis]